MCASVNGSEPDCEDTFNNTGNKFYYPSCSGIRKGRMGNFPATECIKMKAKIGRFLHSISLNLKEGYYRENGHMLNIF